ncbi:MAG TPA: long-chain fatty acid--CoA ligase [Acidimicrobiaceae bacterium]|jgi:long-chain acyl-CoA synthetase|nr:long-chain fatty acid--CoA ligase [Acidimicrobiaceae bacterium]|tara:strand:+ start:4128 stop:5768 length:1641 start_codon:yes stop_codon:yes gene_type:complete
MNFTTDSRFDFSRKQVDAINSEHYTSVLDLFERACSEFAEKIAFSCLGQDISFRQIDEMSGKFAAFLRGDAGLQHGDRVAIQLPNLIQYPVAAWGILRAGLVLVNTNPLYTERELRHQFQDSGAKAVVMLSDFVAAAEQVIPDTDIKLVITTNALDMMEPQPGPTHNLDQSVVLLTLPAAISLGQGKGSGSGLSGARPTVNDLAVLQYTGGTTGVAKGAMLSHGNIISAIAQGRNHLAEAQGESETRLLIAPLPIYHIFGFTLYLCGNFASGGRSVLIPNPRDLYGLLDVMRSVPFTEFAAVNTMLVGLMANQKFDDVDWSNLKWTIAGGAALVPDVAREWERRTDSKLIEGYGLSETTANLSLNVPSSRRIGSVGQAMGFQEIKLMDSSGKMVADGNEGELWVRGPNVMMGYWKRREATEEAIDPEGFFKTGDVAVKLDNGFYKVVDRIKDMILVSGFNVYPNEIENVLYSHPDVLECAVVGVVDDHSGEAVKAFVVVRNSGLTATALREFCRQDLTAYKVPKNIEFRDGLPKSNVGKILRRELR